MRVPDPAALPPASPSPGAPRRAAVLALSSVVALAACATPPPHPRAVEEVRRGYAHLAAGDRERAEVAFEHALEMAPDLPEGRLGLAAALRAAGRAAEALVHLDHAVGVDPDLAEGHGNRGEALASLGRDDEAEAAFADALRVDPDQVPARVDRARLLAHRAAAAAPPARDALLDRARRDLLHALEASPGSALVHQDLGWVELQRGDLQAAAGSYLRAEAIDPRLAGAALGACVALALGGACAEAEVACRRCAGAAAPGSPEGERCAANLSALAGCGAAAPGTPPVPRKAKGAPARTGAPSRESG